MGRGVVQVIVDFLDIFTMVAFGVGQSEQTLFQNGVTAIPQSDGKADMLVAIADAGQAVLVPSINTTAGVIMGKVVPGFHVVAIILSDRAPGAFT